MEEYTYFGYDRRAVRILGSRNLDSCKEVLLAIGTECTDGKLAAGEYDRFHQPFEHEAESRGGEGHRVGTVQDDKAIVSLIVAIDDAYELGPKGGVHVRRVDWRVEGIGEYVEVELLDFGHMLQELVEVEVLQSTRFRVLYHTDSAARVNEQHRGRCGVRAHT